jgi:hypothetical protein
MTVSSGYDAVGLLKMVKDVAHDQTEAKQTVMGFVESTAELFTYHQGENVSDDDYSIMFNASVESIKAHGGQPWHHPRLADMHTKRIAVEMTKADGLTATTVSTTRGTEILKIARKKGAEIANNEFLACQFILGADNKRYKRLKTELGNRFVFGNDDYPKDITQALALLKNFKHEGGVKSSNNSNSKDESPGVAFVQPGGAAVARDYTRDKSKD